MNARKDTATMCQECDSLRQSLAKAHDNLMDQNQTIDAQAKELTRLKREHTIVSETSPAAMLVRKVLDFWNEDHPKANTSMDGARAKMVRTAVGFGHTNPPLDCPVCGTAKGKRAKGAMCTVADELIEALWLLRLKPYVGKGGRRPDAVEGTGRFDDIKYALCEKTGERGIWKVSEAAIERNRALVRRERMSSVERLWVVCEATGHTNDYWAEMLRNKLEEMRRDVSFDANGNGHHKGATVGLDQGRGEGAMNGSTVSGGSESADATLFGPGGSPGDQAGGGGRGDSSEDDGGVGKAQAHRVVEEP